MIPDACITFIQCDLTSLESIKASIRKFTHNRLDVLIRSADIMTQPPELSKDGYEVQFATNHLDYATLIKQLLPKMLKTAEQFGADVRIVFVSFVN